MIEVREDVTFYEGHLSEVTFNFDHYDDEGVRALFARTRELSNLMTISYGRGFSAITRSTERGPREFRPGPTDP